MHQILFYVETLRKHWWIVAVTTLAAVLVALVISNRETPIYEANARLIISPNPGLQERDLLDSLDPLNETTLSSTYAEIMDSENILLATAIDLELEVDEVEDYDRTAVVLPESNILVLRLSGTDPELAASLANAIGQKSIPYLEELYPVYNIRMLDAAQAPASPASPQPQRAAALAGFLGLVFGTFLAILREELARALHHETAIEPYQPQPDSFPASGNAIFIVSDRDKHEHFLEDDLKDFDGLIEAHVDKD